MKSRTASKIWVSIFLAFILTVLAAVAIKVVHIDPFFHYHKPLTSEYSYVLDNERSQNDGILKHFDYDAIIIGTSMTENFKTSEMDALFGTNSIKVPFSGGTFKEINDNVIKAIESNPDLKYVVRGLDMGKFIEDKDAIREDLGDYPTYLYDDNILNDVNYVFNRDVIFDRVYPMTKADTHGITSFDTYANWMKFNTFGINTVCPDGISEQEPGEPVHITDDERETVIGNIKQNITSVAKEHPEITFYYFIPPYSAVRWKSLVDDGTIYRQTEAERIVIEEILPYENIKLFSFNNLPDITTDINNYKDDAHYGQWINSLMLGYMRDGKGLLTPENYEAYLEEEFNFYNTYDYSALNGQVDYENDYYCAALLNEKVNNVSPLNFTFEKLQGAAFNKAKLSLDESGNPIVTCIGSLQIPYGSGISTAEYMNETEYVGFELSVDITDYNYVMFYGKKEKDHGQPTVYVYDDEGTKVAGFTRTYHDIDNEKHQYLIDVSALTGNVKIIFNGGYVDSSGSADSTYIFSEIALY